MKHYGRVSETPSFPVGGEIHKKSLQIVNLIFYYGDRELVRHSIFSTAGSSGKANHVKASQPHFPHFPLCLLCGISSDLEAE